MKERGRKTPSCENLAGSLLLAHPVLKDPNFSRTVVLMSLHNEQGAMGVVINRPLGKTLSSLGKEFDGSPLGQVPLYSGGPVNSDQLLLVAWQAAEEENSFRLFFGIEPMRLETLLREESAIEARAFLGYSGWSKGQLEKEMARGTWLVSQVPPTILDDLDGAELWREIIASISPEWRLLAGEPEDLEKN